MILLGSTIAFIKFIMLASNISDYSIFITIELFLYL